jgi:predicted transcriptional regulator
MEWTKLMDEAVKEKEPQPGSFSIQDVMARYKFSIGRATRLVVHLQKSGLVQKMGGGAKTRYLLTSQGQQLGRGKLPELRPTRPVPSIL